MKLQVTVSDDLVAQLDRYAEMMGVSRSALCAVFIGQGVLGYNKSFKVLDDIGQKLGDSLLVDKTMKSLGEDVTE